MKNKKQKPSKYSKNSSNNPTELFRIIVDEDTPQSKISRKKKRGKTKKDDN
ncbi:hypothetical protein [Salinicoccus roseus]|uniref:hypothetical protein n=1 Tax=Salinicoccus roseus TaxID=45670 RepID=UPI003DA0A779